MTDLNDIYDNFISNSLSFFVFMCLKNGDKMFVNITFCGGKNWAKNLIWLRLDYNKLRQQLITQELAELAGGGDDGDDD